MDERGVDLSRAMLKMVAPGTALRAGLDNILAARTGALIVIGDEDTVEELCNGGFYLATPFTPQRLFELAKMDGAIILDSECRIILKANVHLVPDPTLQTAETGMRHRTAERMSRHTDALVISVSQRRDLITLYRGGEKVAVSDIDVVLAKANQALQTLQRYRTRLDEVSARLTALEFEDEVTVGDVVTVVQRSELAQRVARDVGRYIAELGTEGRLVGMQAEELMIAAEEDYVMLLRDYRQGPTRRKMTGLLSRIASATAEQLLDASALAQTLGFPATVDVLEHRVRPRGYRLLRRVPGLPATVINRLVERFGSLTELVSAPVEELNEVEGVGERRTVAILEALRRMREHG